MPAQARSHFTTTVAIYLLYPTQTFLLGKRETGAQPSQQTVWDWLYFHLPAMIPLYVCSLFPRRVGP
jgi:hypothetical protein